MPSVFGWAFNDVTTTGPDPFANSSSYDEDAVGNSTFTIAPTASGTVIDLVDIDPTFGDNSDQELTSSLSFNGTSFASGGSVRLEYSYVVRPQGSSDPADNVKIYVFEIDSGNQGFVADGPLTPGTTYEFVATDSNDPSVPYDSVFVCFAPGTMILTPDGERPVETLGPGDLVVTRDRGARPLDWIGSRTLNLPPGPHEQKPIEIKAGALGPGVPHRSLVVSPLHRMLLSGAAVAGHCGNEEVFGLAKGLVGLDHVRVMNGKREITYFTLLCDRHEVIRANGAWAETFYPGPTALKMIGARMRCEVEAILPAVKADPVNGFGPTARHLLTRLETERLVIALRAAGAPAAAGTSVQETPASGTGTRMSGDAVRHRKRADQRACPENSAV